MLAVKNPDYFDFAAKKPYSHGFHRLPDGTLTPLHVHMALMAARDGTIYATSIYPFTLIRIPPPPKKVAAIVTTAYYHNSHADVIASRLLETDTLDGKGRTPTLKLASLYTDQISENRPTSARPWRSATESAISPSIEDALTLGTAASRSTASSSSASTAIIRARRRASIQYPKRSFFEEIVEGLRKSGRVVPVFCDKHLADTAEDAQGIYDTARRLKIPLMAGSSLPALWRDPAVDLRRGEEIEEIVAISYRTLDAYGFHALEMVQSLAERRKGGETGIRAVQCITGEDVWKEGLFDPELLASAFRRQKGSPEFDDKAKRSVKEPVLFRIEYADGLRVSILTLNHAAREWAVAWRTRGGEEQSTRFITQEARPFMHFAYLRHEAGRLLLPPISSARRPPTRGRRGSASARSPGGRPHTRSGRAPAPSRSASPSRRARDSLSGGGTPRPAAPDRRGRPSTRRRP